MDPATIGLLGSGLGAIAKLYSQSQADKHDALMRAIGGSTESFDAAAKRSSGWGRSFALVIILTVGFGGLIYAAYSEIPVSQIVEKKPWLDLLGLLKIGGGQSIIEASGFVIPEYVADSITALIGFLFGQSAVKR